MPPDPPAPTASPTTPHPPPTTPLAQTRRRQPQRNIGAAFAASSLYTFSTYPFHRVKILMQTQDANPAVLSGAQRRFKFFSAFGRLIREHGGRPTGLWHGCTPYLARHIPSVSISFAAKDFFRSALLPLAAAGQKGGGAQSSAAAAAPAPARLLAANAAAGGAAGALALAIVYPFELLTIRMAADVGGGGAAGGRHGPAATSAAAPTPPSATATTAAASTTAAAKTPGEIARVATATAATAVAPPAAAPPPPAGSYQFGRSPLDAAKAVVAADGVRGLYRGFGPAVLSAACYKALYFGLHDSAKQYAYGGKYADHAAAAASRDSEGEEGFDAASPARGAAPRWRLGHDPPLALVRAVLERLSIASGTTVVAATLTHPLDVIRKRLVVDSRGQLYGGSVAGVCAGVWRREGVKGFFRFLPQDVFLRSGAGLILVTYDMLV